jgi:hypothetical protein
VAATSLVHNQERNGIKKTNLKRVMKAETDSEQLDRAPNSALVMDNNLGTAPGPERNHQVLSAYGPAGLDFHMAKLDLLKLWRLSGDKTEQTVAEIISKEVIPLIESKRRCKLSTERLTVIAQSCRLGIRNAERTRRLTRSEMVAAIQRQFQREKLLPP